MSTKSRGSTEPSIAIKAWAMEYMAAVKAGDIDENLSLHTEDVIWMPPEVPIVRSSKANLPELV